MMSEQGLYIGEKTAFFSPEGHKRRNSFAIGKPGRGMAHFLTSQYEMCEREGKKIVVVDPKSDFK
ncbi:hypothetical protein NYE34_21380 [Bacillus sp. FSL R5-0418]